MVRELEHLPEYRADGGLVSGERGRFRQVRNDQERGGPIGDPGVSSKVRDPVDGRSGGGSGRGGWNNIMSL